MKGASLQRLFIGPQIQRLPGRVDTVAGGAVQIEVNMHAVLPSKPDGIVNVLQVLRTHLQQVIRVCPKEIRQRQPRKVEAPLGQEREIPFLEWDIAFARLDAFLGQVESTPSRQPASADGLMFGRWERHRRSRSRGNGDCARSLEELSAIHSHARPKNNYAVCEGGCQWRCVEISAHTSLILRCLV